MLVLVKCRVSQFDFNLAAFVWMESSDDIPANTAWTPLATRTLPESGALVMKSRAYTPTIQT